mmetsp:Transcript_38054/g.83702  ORF Transcript_38054/g.83702 Transcript_38054/m.83702 type:complete len:314 (+) Transcript_38054:240-1181(+)
MTLATSSTSSTRRVSASASASSAATSCIAGRRVLRSTGNRGPKAHAAPVARQQRGQQKVSMASASSTPTQCAWNHASQLSQPTQLSSPCCAASASPVQQGQLCSISAALGGHSAESASAAPSISARGRLHPSLMKSASASRIQDFAARSALASCLAATATSDTLLSCFEALTSAWAASRQPPPCSSIGRARPSHAAAAAVFSKSASRASTWSSRSDAEAQRSCIRSKLLPRLSASVASAAHDCATRTVSSRRESVVAAPSARDSAWPRATSVRARSSGGKGGRASKAACDAARAASIGSAARIAHISTRDASS